MQNQEHRPEQAAANDLSFTMLAQAFGQLYDVIYYVDLDSDEYTEYHCNDEPSPEGDTRGTGFFSDILQTIEANIFPDDSAVITKAMEKSTFVKDLDDNGCVVLNFRLVQDDRPQYASLFAVRPNKGSNHAIIAISNIDGARRRELQFVEKFGSPMEFSTRDKLTRVKNKYAYDKALAELDEEINQIGYSDVAVVVADINGLSQINEAQGRDAGDEFIKSACHMICTTFKRSPVFRTDGGEFAVIMKGEDFDNRDRLMEELAQAVEAAREGGVAAFASGMSVFDFATDHDIKTVFDRANAAMLENKRVQKSAVQTA